MAEEFSSIQISTKRTPPPEIIGELEDEKVEYPQLDLGVYELRKSQITVDYAVSHARKKYTLNLRVLVDNDPLLETYGDKDITSQTKFKPNDRVFIIQFQERDQPRSAIVREDSFYFNNPTLNEDDFKRVEDKS